MRLLIHPLFILVAVLTIFYTATNFFIALMIAVILHEGAHLLMAKHFGIIAQRIALTPFGGSIRLQTEFLTIRQKNLIYISGPVASLLFALFFGVIVWLFPAIFVYLEVLVVANFMVGIMNLLPIYALDGGKILANLIKPIYILIWSNAVLLVLLIIAIWHFNFWFIAFTIIALIQINWEYRSSLYHDKFFVGNHSKTGPFLRCAVVSQTTLFAAYQMIDRKKPMEFVVTDFENRLFYEKDLEQWLIKYPINTPIQKVLIQI